MRVFSLPSSVDWFSRLLEQLKKSNLPIIRQKSAASFVHEERRQRIPSVTFILANFTKYHRPWYSNLHLPQLHRPSEYRASFSRRSICEKVGFAARKSRGGRKAFDTEALWAIGSFFFQTCVQCSKPFKEKSASLIRSQAVTLIPTFRLRNGILRLRVLANF